MASSTETSSEVLNDDHQRIVHCDHCNSDVPEQHLLARSWAGETMPSCPNCGTPIAAMRAGVESSGFDGYDFHPDRIEGDELRLCPHCSGAYRRLSFNPATGEVQPVRFCPNCGRPVNPRQ